MPSTPKYGMPIPQGGTTPGALNNTTSGSYPFMFGDPTTGILGILDSDTYGIPNPVPIGTGLLVNANLNMLGFSITNTANLTLSGTLSVGGASTLTGGVVSPLLIGAGLLNQVTITAKATGSDPTITVAGDATRNLGIVVPGSNSGLTLSNGGGGFSITQVTGGPLSLNAVSGQNLGLYAGSGASATLGAAGTGYLSVNSSGVYVLTNIPILQNSAATALTLKGNAAATGSLGGVVLVGSQSTTQTSGITLSIQNPIGTAIATVDYAGNLNLAGSTIAETTASTSLVIKGNAAGAATGVVITNVGDVGATGYALLIAANSLSQLAVSGRGHIIPLSTAPTVATTQADWGTSPTISVAGSDASMIVTVVAGTAPATFATVGLPMFTVTLAGVGYSSTGYSALCSQVNAFQTAAETTWCQATVTTVGTIVVNNLNVNFTPIAGHTYKFAVTTMGAGATS
jgi:hypothetical protein